MAMKRCSKCEAEKPLEAFHTSTRSKDGRHVWCKVCSRTYVIERWRQKNPGRPRRLKYAKDAVAKVCAACQSVKPLDEFHRTQHGACGRKAICKTCTIAQRDPLMSRRSLLKNKYGLTLAGYEAMLFKQDGKCAICGSTSPGPTEKHFHIDHDHVTGQVRGLLCELCNVGLGHFGDSPERLEMAAIYLRSFPATN